MGEAGLFLQCSESVANVLYVKLSINMGHCLQTKIPMVIDEV